MSSFGQTLRQAREAKGLTPSQVAAQTHILVQIISDMENEDFHSIAAPIYGRGFVRLFAECVGLDPQPLIREFMDIYEGRRAPTVLVREVPTVAVPESTPEPEPFSDPEPGSAPEPVPAPEPIPEPIPEPPPIIRGLDLFEQTATQPIPPAATSIPPASSVPPAPPHPSFDEAAFLPPSYEDAGPSAADRFRTGLSSVSHGILQTVRSIPRSMWRITLLALAALAVIALAVFGCIKLYQATSNMPPTPGTEPPQAPQQPTAAPDAKTTAPAAQPAPALKPAPIRAPGRLRSTGQKTAPFYVD